jgi:hypothetical protein
MQGKILAFYTDFSSRYLKPFQEKLKQKVTSDKLDLKTTHVLKSDETLKEIA